MTDIATLGFAVDTGDLKKTDDYLVALAKKSDVVQAKFKNVGESFAGLYSNSPQAANDKTWQDHAKVITKATDALKTYKTAALGASEAAKKVASAIGKIDQNSLKAAESIGKVNQNSKKASASVGKLTQSSTKAAQSISKTHQNSAKAAQAIGKVHQNSTKAAQSIGKVHQNSSKASTSLGKANQSAKKAAESIGKVGDNSSAAAQSIGKFNQNASKAAQSVGRVNKNATGAADSLGKVHQNTLKAAGSFSKVEQNSEKAKSSLGRIGRSASSASTALDKTTGSSGRVVGGFGKVKTMLATMGLTAFIKSTLSLSTDFEASMNDVQEKLGISIDQMGVMRDAAQQLGISTAFSASQAAEAMGNLAQAGLDSEEVLVALPHTLNLAAAAGLELSRASVITTDTMNAFRLEVDDTGRIVDVLAAAGDAASTDVNQMAEALSKAGPTAAAFGISLEETTATLGVLANNGIKGSLAGTALTAAMTRLVNPLGEGEKALSELTLSAADFIKIGNEGEENFIGFAEAIDILTAAGATNTDIMKIFGQEHGPKLQALMGAGSQSIRTMEKDITSNGQAAAQAQTKMQGLPGAVKGFQSAWQGASLAVADSFLKDGAVAAIDAITKGIRLFATDGIDFLSTKVSQFKNAWQDIQQTDYEIAAFGEIDKGSKALQAFVGIAKTVISAIAPLAPHIDVLVVAFVSFKTAAAISKVTAAATASIIALRAVMSGGALAGAIGLVSSAMVALKVAILANPITAAITAIGVAVYVIYDNWDGLVAWWGDMWSSITDLSKSFLSWWNGDATPKEKILVIEDEALTAAMNLSIDFFSWWDNSALKKVAPEIVIDSIESARALSDRFFAWWKSTTMQEKVAQVKTGAIDLARTNYIKFSKWWDGTTLAEKAMQISDVAIGVAQIAANKFFSWWDGSKLKEIAPTILVDGVEKAQTELTKFFRWWDATPMDERVATIKTKSIDIAKEVTSRFVTWWNSDGTLAEKAAIIATDSIDIAQDALSKFKASWEGSQFREISPKFVVASIDAAISAVETLLEWWEKPLKEKTASITFTAITKAREAMEKLVEWWNKIKLLNPFRDMDGDVKGALKDVGSTITDAGSSLWQKMLNVGGDVVSGMAQGISQSNEHKLAAKKMANEVEEVAKAELEIRSPSRVTMALGGWTAEGFALGITNKSGVVRQAALDMATQAAEAVERGIGQLRNGIADSILDATSFKDAGRNAEQFLKGWLNTQIKHFAKNKIMAFLGADTQGVSMLGGILEKLGNIDTGLIGSIKGLLGSGTNGITGMLGSVKSVFSSGGPLLTGIKSIGSSIAAVGPALLPLAGIGVALAGIKSAFGSSWKSVAQGIEVGYSDGAVEGQNFDLQSKKKSFWRGREYATIYSELDAEVGKQLNDFFGGMKQTITEQAALLGVEGADSILDSFSVAVEKFSGENAEQELQAWLSESTRSAYQMAFDQLGPEVQQIIGGQVDLLTAEVDTIAAVFGSVATVFDEIGPKLTQVGLDFSGSMDAQIASTYRLTEALGGTEAAMQQLDLYAREFVPAAQQVDASLKDSRASLAEWNASFGITQTQYTDKMKDTRAELVAHIEQIDAKRDSLERAGAMTDSLSARYDTMTAEAFAQMEAIIAVEDAMIKQRETMTSVVDAASMLNLRFDEYHPNAQGMADSLVEIMGGMEAFTSATQSYYSQYFSDEEQKQIALAASAAEVVKFNDTLAQMGVGAISTKEGLRAFVEAQDLSTASGQRAFVAAMEVSNAMVAVADSGRTASEIMGSTPQELNAAATAIQQQTSQMATDFDTTAGALKETITGVQQASEAANDAIGQTPDQITQAASAIDSQAQAMAASFGATSGQISATMGKVESSSNAVNEVMGSTPEKLAKVTEAMGLNMRMMLHGVELTGNAMSLTMQRAANDTGKHLSGAAAYYDNAGKSISVSANGASTSIRGLSATIFQLGNASKTAAATASQAAATTAAAANKAAAAQRQAIQYANSVRIDGSHSTGLDYVPKDGYIAELHKGEMVIPASISDQLRALGTSSRSIGLTTPVAPRSNQGGEDVSALNAQLSMIREELSKLRQERAESAGEANSALGAIAGSSSQQNRQLGELKREVERNERRKKVA